MGTAETGKIGRPQTLKGFHAMLRLTGREADRRGVKLQLLNVIV